MIRRSVQSKRAFFFNGARLPQSHRHSRTSTIYTKITSPSSYFRCTNVHRSLVTQAFLANKRGSTLCFSGEHLWLQSHRAQCLNSRSSCSTLLWLHVIGRLIILRAAIQQFPYSAVHRLARREHLAAPRSSSASTLSPVIQTRDRFTSICPLRDWVAHAGLASHVMYCLRFFFSHHIGRSTTDHRESDRFPKGRGA